MSLGITVVICTYNGADLLPKTIEHIAAQCVRPDIAWEVIVVDNASADSSSEIAITEWEKYRLCVPFKVVSQPKPGLTFAREMAIEASAYELVLFCDDDNWLSPSYVNTAYDTMSKHPRIGMLGGHGELVFESSQPPHWATYLGLFAAGPQAKVSGKVSNNVVYGAGCIMRKSAYAVLKRAGFKSMLTDREGNALSAGGDIELCFVITLAGYEVWYDEKLKFKHFMPKKRVSTEYFIRYYKDGAKSFEVLVPYRIIVNLGSKKLTSFYIMLTRIYLSYVVKLTYTNLKKLFLRSDSEAYNTMILQSSALSYKLLSFIQFRLMRKNYFKIIELEKNLSKHTKPVQLSLI